MASIWIVITHPALEGLFFDVPLLKYTAAYIGIILSSLGIFFYTKKLLDKRPGIILDNNGITDNSGGLSSLGVIAWNDISTIKEIAIRQSLGIWKITHQKFIGLVFINPASYILQQQNVLKRKEMEYNHKIFGTPVLISSNGLKMNHAELLELFTKKLSE
jgi:hypothetical protein